VALSASRRSDRPKVLRIYGSSSQWGGLFAILCSITSGISRTVVADLQEVHNHTGAMSHTVGQEPGELPRRRVGFSTQMVRGETLVSRPAFADQNASPYPPDDRDRRMDGALGLGAEILIVYG